MDNRMTQIPKQMIGSQPFQKRVDTLQPCRFEMRLIG